MNTLHYSLKAKCQGCIALKSVGHTFTCAFQVPLHFEETPSGDAVRPSPMEKCYKPKTMKELKDAVKLTEAKLAKESA